MTFSSYDESLCLFLQSEQQKIISELNEKLDEYKRKESYGLYKSSSESIGSLRESGESVSVISLVEKPSQQLAPTGEKFIIKTPKSSKVQVVVASDASNATTQEAKQPSPTTNLNSEEANKKIDKLKESLQRVEDELKIEKEKSAAFEVEFTSLQSDKVRVEQERSELEIQLEDIKRENERAMEELTQKLEDAERENKRYFILSTLARLIFIGLNLAPLFNNPGVDSITPIRHLSHTILYFHTHHFSIFTLKEQKLDEAGGELEPNCGPQLLLGSLMRTRRSAPVSYWLIFPTAVLTVPEVFAKVVTVQYYSRF